MTDLVKFIECVDNALRDIEKNIAHDEAMHAIKFMQQYCRNMLSYLNALQNTKGRDNKVYIVLHSLFPLFLYQNDVLADAAMKSLNLQAVDTNADFIDIIEQVAQAIIEHHHSDDIQKFLSAETVRANCYLFLAGVMFACTFALMFTLLPSSVGFIGAVLFPILGGLAACVLPALYSIAIKGKVKLYEPNEVAHNMGKYSNQSDIQVCYSVAQNHRKTTKTWTSDTGTLFSAGTVRYEPIIYTNSDPTGIVPDDTYQAGTQIFVSKVKKADIVQGLRTSNSGLFKDHTNKTIAEQVEMITCCSIG